MCCVELLLSGIICSRSRNPPPVMRKAESTGLRGQLFRRNVDTRYAGTSVTADKKQLRNGSPLRLAVFRDKPKYPMLMAILSEKHNP